MSEQLVMDPLEETTGRVEFDLTPFVGPDGPDWGDAQIQAHMAEAARGQVPVDFRLPNRTITIPLTLMARGDLSFEEVRTMLQAKVGLWQQEGGVLKREINGTPWYADVVNAELRMGGSTAQAVQDVDTDARLVLETIPDWYGPETLLGAATGTGEIVAVFEPDKGDHPGRARIVVTDQSGERQLGLQWGIRSRYHSSDPTAALAYEAEDLTLLDLAEIGTVTGASGGGSDNVVKHPQLGSAWTPVLSTDIPDVGPMTHVGTYRVWARMMAASLAVVRARLSWSVGGIGGATANRPVTFPALSTNIWKIVDLGVVRLERPPVGDHQWRGVIQGSAEHTSNDLFVDKIWLQPVSEFAGVLRSPVRFEQGVSDYVGRDEFDGSGASLDGRVAAVGGQWATSGATTDFATSGSGTVTRATQTDTVPGRFAVLGSTDLARVAACIDITRTDNSGGFAYGLVLRYVDVDNWLTVRRTPLGIGIEGRVGGNPLLPANTLEEDPPDTGVTTTLAAIVDEFGRVFVWSFLPGAHPGDPVLVGHSDQLATGGDLESGAVGFFDHVSGSGGTRTFDNFAAWVPTLDAVIHANQWLELRTDGAYRAGADGNASAPIVPSGDLPRIPPAGLEGRKTELLLVTSRGELDLVPDTSRADDLAVEAHYRPSWLFVPDPSPGS